MSRLEATRLEENSAVSLSVELAGIHLKNPVLSASGTFGYGEEYSSVFDIAQLGGIVVKGTTVKPRAGNSPPRMVEVTGGILSSCGLQNVGVDRFIEEKMPFLRRVGVPVVVNLAGESPEEFRLLVERLEEVEGIAAYELNVSCPNVRSGGMAFGISAEATTKVVRAARERSNRPIICKLSPNVTNIVDIARAAESAGADVIALINAPLGLAIDCETRRPRLGNVTGGLTGPAIKPIALRMVWQVCGAVSVPVIGIGGISQWQDAAEFIIAGATAVEVGTAFFFDPLVGVHVIEGLADYLKRHGLKNLDELRGSLRLS